MKRTLDRMLAMLLILILLVGMTLCGCYLVSECREMLEWLEEFDRTEFATIGYPERVMYATDDKETWQQMLEAEGQQ